MGDHQTYQPAQTFLTPFQLKMKMPFQGKNIYIVSPRKQHLIRIIKLNYNRAVSDTKSEGDKM